MGNMVFLMLFVTPALTMRLLAEERKQKTLALLLTSPVANWEIVIGKFLACLGYLCAVLVVSLIYPWVLTQYGNPDLGVIASSYLGAVLCASSLVAMGLFASSLSDSQMMAAVLAFGLSLFFWLIQFSQGFLQRNFTEGLAELVGALSIYAPFRQFLSGAVHIKYVVFYLSFSGFFLYLASRKLASNSWR
jgi:ABC-2 type transport system permease protein